MVKEIVEGIRGTNVKAGIIGEIGTSYNKWTEAEQKVFEAVVMAHKQTKSQSLHILPLEHWDMNK